MTAEAIDAAAATIWRLWQTGEAICELEAAARPSSRAEGYAAQAALERLAGGRVGWKIAATSAAGQRHIGVSGPIAGRIFPTRLHGPGAAVPLAHNRMRVAEPEFAFRFATALPPRSRRYETHEILAAVASLHPALELPDSRFLDFAAVGEATLIADDACAGELVLGEATASDWRGIDLSRHAVEGEVAGRYRREGTGANVLGDPRIALTWIVNELSGLGIGLGPGEFVTTGTCMQPLEIEPGDMVRADFGALGTISAAIV